MSALTDIFSAIATAIRGKNGKTDTYLPENMAQAIDEITVTDTTDANATAAKILTGYSAYVNGIRIDGSMPNGTSSNLIVSFSKNATSGNINATARVTKAGYYTTSLLSPTFVKTPVDIEPNFVAGNIKSGVQIFNICGTYEGEKPVISVSDSGRITATAGEISADPVILSASHDLHFTEANIKKGINIFGKTGSYDPLNDGYLKAGVAEVYYETYKVTKIYATWVDNGTAAYSVRSFGDLATEDIYLLNGSILLIRSSDTEMNISVSGSVEILKYTTDKTSYDLRVYGSGSIIVE